MYNPSFVKSINYKKAVLHAARVRLTLTQCFAAEVGYINSSDVMREIHSLFAVYLHVATARLKPI
jgi:hypothetical protein